MPIKPYMPMKGCTSYTFHNVAVNFKEVIEVLLAGFVRQGYTSIQMKCLGGVIFVHAPRLFCCPKRRIEYAHCSLTGNKNYPAITKLTNTM